MRELGSTPSIPVSEDGMKKTKKKTTTKRKPAKKVYPRRELLLTIAGIFLIGSICLFIASVTKEKDDGAKVVSQNAIVTETDSGIVIQTSSSTYLVPNDVANMTRVHPISLRSDPLYMSVVGSFDGIDIYYGTQEAVAKGCDCYFCSGCYNTLFKTVKIEETYDNQSTSMRWAGLHEMGHKYWHEVMSDEERNQYAKLLDYTCDPPITQYAQSELSEDFAENFAAYYYNGTEPLRGTPQSMLLRDFIGGSVRDHNFPAIGEFESNISCSIDRGDTKGITNDTGSKTITVTMHPDGKLVDQNGNVIGGWGWATS